MTKSFQHIYLSPHYDDAVLSCGGIIHRQTQAGERVLVMTVFAAPPPAGEHFSPFAQSLHDSWGGMDNIIAVRRREDRTATGILGADYAWLEFVDCIYRGEPNNATWFYNNDDDLFGAIHRADWNLVGPIIKTIKQQEAIGTASIVYAPLAVGYHVDHQLIHAAAYQLHAQGWTVVFYEDYPYADPTVKYGSFKVEETVARLAQAEQPLQPHRQFFSEKDLQAKIDSTKAYASQLETLFGSEAKVAEMVQAYARQVGEGQYAERLWVPK